jgi:hypothetical protein
MGYGDDVTEEMLDELVDQMSKMLEFENVGNTINFKTGCLIQSLVLKNQPEVKNELEEQIRSSRTLKLPPLQFQLTRTCLNLEENNQCKILVAWNKEDSLCKYLDGDYTNCEIVRNSVDQGMNEWR